MTSIAKIVLPLLVLGVLGLSPDVADAQSCRADPEQPKCLDGGGDGGGKPGGKPDGDGGDGGTGGLPPTYSWMHPDIGLAFDADTFGGSFTGKGANIVILDNFTRGSRLRGNLRDRRERLYHGEWTSLQAQLVAPDANPVDVSNNIADDPASTTINSYFTDGALNVVNLSFGLLDEAGTDVDAPGYELGTTLWDSVVTGARAGDAVYVKAAGNEGGAAIDGTFSGLLYGISGSAQDSLNLQLIGAQGAIFVGALNSDGTVDDKATLASYSTYSGNAASGQYLVVGVDSSSTGLSGTSFAAPIVSGYAAIIGDKFDTASPVQIVDQLLGTAREDTISGYNSSIHGQGEACLGCALSPAEIPN